MAVEDLSGRRFGRLVVLARCAPPRPCKGRDAWYLCKCDCGKLKAVRAPSLKKGDVFSCGCLRAELDAGKDYTGVRRGHLTGVSSTGERSGRAYVWAWRCDCGNIVYGTPGHIGRKGGITRCEECRSCYLTEQGAALSANHRADNGMMRGNLDALLDGKPTSANRSGVRGVYYNAAARKYAATIRKDGKQKFLGYYATPEEAAEVRKKAVREVYGTKEEYHLASDASRQGKEKE